MIPGRRHPACRLGLGLVLTLLAAATGAPAHAADSDSTVFQVETRHLLLAWSYQPDSAEVASVQGAAERFHDDVAAFLGHTPDRRITIWLRGPSERPGGRREHPRVDAYGRIHLFTYGPPPVGYLSPLAHELVHAFRTDRRLSSDWFFEEGFAEFVALRVDPSLAGFPWYERPVVIAAGQWLEHGEYLPLTDQRRRHAELNLACRAQTYTLRSAFFDWLGRTRGDSVLVAMARADSAGLERHYEEAFGAPLDALEAEWLEALNAEYRAFPDAAERARSYREETPIQYMPVCPAAPKE